MGTTRGCLANDVERDGQAQGLEVKAIEGVVIRSLKLNLILSILLTRRSAARQEKAVKIFPLPTAGLLRLIAHGYTLKYNMKVRAGRAFSLEELKAAGVPKKLAPTIGIVVDYRRRNRSLEGLQAYGSFMPITREIPLFELVKVTEEMKNFKAYGKLRTETTNTRHVGVREKRAAEAEKEEKK
ncbi:hypothetical protein GIB67_005644 [Kingdonia uniflora]|uniref:Uncharacterized protein n=1 Tax=Kingdonia uniflora TaxID=39325 RepID=A0A7J7NIP0_9MAGN|nr:hypothetical protein GIB67_005644 [Kingdonia uniflora]